LVHIYGPQGSVIEEVFINSAYGVLVAAYEAGRPVWGSEAEILRGDQATLTYLFREPVPPAAGETPAVVTPGTAVPAVVSMVSSGTTAACSTDSWDFAQIAELLEAPRSL
jgi:hypothetical protein